MATTFSFLLSVTATVLAVVVAVAPSVDILGAAPHGVTDEPRQIYSLDFDWTFHLKNTEIMNCSGDAFPIDLSDQQCFGLAQMPYITNAEDCRAQCCGDVCTVWQWCPGGDAECGEAACWTGNPDLDACSAGSGWESEGREVVPPAPNSTDVCNVTVTPECGPDYDDSDWREVILPHDFGEWVFVF